MSKKSAKILRGKELSEEIFLHLREKIVDAEKKNKDAPGLAVVMVGHDPESALYVRNKKKACQKVGIIFHDYLLPEKTTEKEINEIIDFLNNDPSIYGIIVQLPLPAPLDASCVINMIDPLKDADGFHPENLAKFNLIDDLLHDKKGSIPEKIDMVAPPVIGAVISLLNLVEEKLAGKKAAIISQNEIFAEPLRTTLALKNISSEIISPQGGELERIKDFDIVLSAVGKPGLLRQDMIKEDAIVIDIGTRLVADKLRGDADFDGCAKKAAYISPVPGGIGPLTVAHLLENVIKFWEKERE